MHMLSQGRKDMMIAEVLLMGPPTINVGVQVDIASNVFSSPTGG